MVQHVVADPTYVLGRADAEAQRLMLQAVADRIKPGGVVAFAEVDFQMVAREMMAISQQRRRRHDDAPQAGRAWLTT